MRFFALLLLYASLAAGSYKYPVSICAIFQNEARWIKEWIEYHRLIGVKHFYLYNNLSTDDYKRVLKPYIDKGIVELVEWPYKAQNVPHWTEIQTSAYRDAIGKAKGVSKWLAALDLDEFIVMTEEDNLGRFLKSYENYGGLAVHWQMFGTSDVERVPSNRLMIETLTRKAPDDYGENAFIKTLFRPERVRGMRDPHKPVYRTRYFSVNSRKNKANKNSTNWIFDIEKIRINHYWSRDKEFFFSTKHPRREEWGEGLHCLLERVKRLNQQEDRTILRFVPKLKKRMGFK